MLDACDEDYRATLHLPGFEYTVTVIVDGHLCYPVIAYMIENGQPFSEIIKELQRRRFERRKGEQWTPKLSRKYISATHNTKFSQYYPPCILLRYRENVV